MSTQEYTAMYMYHIDHDITHSPVSPIMMYLNRYLQTKSNRKFLVYQGFATSVKPFLIGTVYHNRFPEATSLITYA